MNPSPAAAPHRTPDPAPPSADRSRRPRRAARPVVAALAALAALAGLGAGPATPVAGQGRDGSVVDSLAAAGRLQEAAWAARAAGDTARGEALLARLEAILRRAPRSARPLAMDSQGVSYTFQLDHGDGVQSIFKVDGSDIFCPACGADREVAVYRIDRLLGFDLTPMTVRATIVHAGDTLPGSAMYYVNGSLPVEAVPGEKPDALRLLDAVVGNSDRHRKNWLRLPGGRVVAIDHNRAFDWHPRSRPKTCWETQIDSIGAPGALGGPYRRYRTLPADSLEASVSDVLEPGLVAELVRMRERVVERIEQRSRDPRRSHPLRDCSFRG